VRIRSLAVACCDGSGSPQAGIKRRDETVLQSEWPRDLKRHARDIKQQKEPAKCRTHAREWIANVRLKPPAGLEPAT
jgi:hypothetical protein